MEDPPIPIPPSLVFHHMLEMTTIATKPAMDQTMTKRPRRRTEMSSFRHNDRILVCAMMIWAACLIRITGSTPNSSLLPVGLLFCRITFENSLYMDPITNRVHGKKQIACQPENTEIMDGLFAIQLSPSWLQAKHHQAALQNGTLRLSITNTVLDVRNEQVILSENSQIEVLKGSEGEEGIDLRRRRLKDHTDATGIRTYAIIRISTIDVEPDMTDHDLVTRYTHASAGFQAQYRACSAGKLEWKLQGVYNVQLPGELAANYNNHAGEVRNAAMLQIVKDYNLKSVEDLADNIMFIIPKGTGNWIANAGTKYWRSQFNNRWALSLTAACHEIGHNLGLGHSNEDGVPYADWTGMMASGLPDPDRPLKCFNAANHVQFGWFSDRTRVWEETEGGKLLKLAAFVDYDKTFASPDELPVLLIIGEVFSLQYNRATRHNIGTEEYKDEIVVIEQLDGSTELRGHLKHVGDSVELAGATIVLCRRLSGDTSLPDVALVGIGSTHLTNSEMLCSFPVENATRTSPPSTAPSTVIPTQLPSTAEPTASLGEESDENFDFFIEVSNRPSHSPSRTATPTVSVPPSDVPSLVPSTTPSNSVVPSLPPNTTFPPTRHKNIFGNSPSIPLKKPSMAPSQIFRPEATSNPSTTRPTRVANAAKDDLFGTSVDVEADGKVKDPKNPADLLEAWERLALGTTWFEYFRR